MLDQEGRFLAVAQKLQLDSWPFILGFLMAYQTVKQMFWSIIFFVFRLNSQKECPYYW